MNNNEKIRTFIAIDIKASSDLITFENEFKNIDSKIKIVEPNNITATIISLDPPPLEIDKTIKNLKRIEFRVPAYLFKNKEGVIRVRLSSEND